MNIFSKSKNFGKKGKQVVVTEMKQLHDKAVDANQLSKKRGNNAVNLLSFVTEKNMAGQME